MRRLRQSRGVMGWWLPPPLTTTTHQTRPNTEHLIQNSVRYNEPITKYQGQILSMICHNRSPSTNIQLHNFTSVALPCYYSIYATENFRWVELSSDSGRRSGKRRLLTTLMKLTSQHRRSLICEMLMVIFLSSARLPIVRFPLVRLPLVRLPLVRLPLVRFLSSGSPTDKWLGEPDQVASDTGGQFEECWLNLAENNTSKTDVALWCFKWTDWLDRRDGWGEVRYRAPYCAKTCPA